MAFENIGGLFRGFRDEYGYGSSYGDPYGNNNLYVNPFRQGDQSAQDTLADLYEAEFQDYLNRFFPVEKDLIAQIKKVQKEEMSMKNVSRKSLIYKTNLSMGHILREKDISSIRPGIGLLGNKIKVVIGKKIKKKVIKGSFVKVSDFEKK